MNTPLKALQYTVIEESNGLYKSKGSKFLSFLNPANNSYQAKECINRIAKQFTDATHLCYAWKIQNTVKCEDDGEPAYSAGAPILRRIKSAALTNVIICVVRYYGGIKLGISGLIDSYQTAAQSAIDDAYKYQRIIAFTQKFKITINVGFDKIGIIEKLISKLKGEIEHINYNYLEYQGPSYTVLFNIHDKDIVLKELLDKQIEYTNVMDYQN